MVKVANLFIYNPTLGNEFTEGEKILAFYPDIDFNTQKFHVGLCEGLIAFAGGFTGIVKLDYIQTEKYHIGVLCPEENFFIIMMIAKDEPNDYDDDCDSTNDDDQSPRLILQHILRHLYTTFTLLNSSFHMIYINESLCGLRDRLTLFLAHYIPLIPLVSTTPHHSELACQLSSNSMLRKCQESDLLQSVGGLHYATMDKIIFLTIRYFISSLSINFPHTDTLALFHQNQLIYTQLPPEQTVALQFILSHEKMIEYMGLNARLCTRRMSDEPIKKKLTQQEAELIPSKCVPIEMIFSPELYIIQNDDDGDSADDDTNRNLEGQKSPKSPMPPFSLPLTATHRHAEHGVAEPNCGMGPFISAHCCRVPQHCQDEQGGSARGPRPSLLADPLSRPDSAVVSPAIFFNKMASSGGSIFDPVLDLDGLQFEYHKNILKDILLYLQSGESSFTWYKRKNEREMELEYNVKQNVLQMQEMAQNDPTPRYQPYLLVLEFGDTHVVLSVTSVVPGHNGDDGSQICSVEEKVEKDKKEDEQNNHSGSKEDRNNDTNVPTQSVSSSICVKKDKSCLCDRGTHPYGIGFHLEMPPSPELGEGQYHSQDGENEPNTSSLESPEETEAPPKAPPLPPLSYNPFTGTTSLYKHFYSQLAQFVHVNVTKIVSLIFTASTNSRQSQSGEVCAYDQSLPPHLYYNKSNWATKSTLNPSLFPLFSTLTDQIHNFHQEITKYRSTNYIQSRALDNTAAITSTGDATMSLVYPTATRSSVLLPLGQQYFSPHNITPLTLPYPSPPAIKNLVKVRSRL